MKEYLDKYMLHDLTQNVTYTCVQDKMPEEKAQYAKSVIEWFNNNKIVEKQSVANQLQINSSISYEKGKS